MTRCITHCINPLKKQQPPDKQNKRAREQESKRAILKPQQKMSIGLNIDIVTRSASAGRRGTKKGRALKPLSDSLIKRNGRGS